MSRGQINQMAGLSRFLGSSTFSDLTLRFSGEEVKVHRVILCSQSKWFEAALEGSFREATANEIELDGDEPDILHAALGYMYDHAFLTRWSEERIRSSRNLCPNNDFSVKQEMLIFLINVYAVADKYAITDLKAEVVHIYDVVYIDRRTGGPVVGADVLKQAHRCIAKRDDPLTKKVLNSYIYCTRKSMAEGGSLEDDLEDEPGLATTVIKRLFEDLPELPRKRHERRNGFNF